MAASAQAALGADAFHGNLTVTGNQANPTEVIPGTQVQLTVTDNPQGYNARVPGTYVPGTSITFSQLNWSVTSGSGLDLTTGSPWTWDNSLLDGFTTFFYDSAPAGQRVVGRRAYHLVQVEPLPKPKTIVGIEATSFILGNLSFPAPAYGASNTYTISLAGGTDAAGTSSALADGSVYLLASNGGLTVPAAYQFTVIPGGAWRGAVSNHFETGGNWSGGGVPDANFTALFDTVSPVPSTAVLYSNQAVKAVRLETAAGGVTIGSGGGSWQLSVGSGGIKSLGAGANTATAGVAFTADASINVGPGNTLSLAGGADAGGHVVNKVGPGTLIVGPQTHAAGSTLNVNEGTVKLDGTQRIDTLNVNAGQAQLTLGGAKVIVTNHLAIGPTAQLDLTDNDMVVNYTGGTYYEPSPTLEAIKGLLASGYAHMAWNGSGIISSEAAADPIGKGIGYAQNDRLFYSFDTFSGEPVSMSTVLIKYTYAGDMNLDGMVDDNDVTFLNLYYDGGAVNTHYWNEGDIFGYDGYVDDNDVTILNLTYRSGLPGGSSGDPLAGGPVGAVPEPATLALVGLGALALFRRRSR